MKLKYMVVGFVAGIVAATAITAGASTVYEKLTAVARPDYTLVVDGEKITLNTPPKTIDGVTHLPIRETANILGMDVNFKSSTITLTSKESEGDTVTTPTTETNTETTTNNPTELIADEWIGVRELAQKINDKLLLTSEHGKQIMFTESGSIRIEFEATSSTEFFVGVTSKGDEIRFWNSKGSTYLYLDDLSKAGIID